MMDGSWFSKIPDLTGLLEYSGLMQLALYGLYIALAVIIVRRFFAWKKALAAAALAKEEEARQLQHQQLSTQQELLHTIQQQNEIIQQYRDQGRN